MKIVSVILKNIREQIRTFWILALTLLTAPFFVFIYYLIIESTGYNYKVAFVNLDDNVGVSVHSENILKIIGDEESTTFRMSEKDSVGEIKKLIEDKQVDLGLIIPANFTEKVENPGTSNSGIEFEFVGDPANMRYLTAAVFIHNYIEEYVYANTTLNKPINLRETVIGNSIRKNEFELQVPGLLIFALIMLIYTASAAFVSEVESGAILRLKLSRTPVAIYIAGIGIVQIGIGFFGLSFAFLTALGLGFEFNGNVLALIVIAFLTCVSIISFSILLAAFGATTSQVTVIGTFPLFLFMFFTGAMFPINSPELFTVNSYGFDVNGLLSPTHAINAMYKIFFLDQGLESIGTEIISILILTVVYLIPGLWLYKKRHMG